MARREIILPIAVGIQPTPFSPFPGGIPPPGGFPGPGFPPSPFGDPYGLPPLPPFLGESIGGGVGGPINPGDQGGWNNNLLGGLLGNISPEGASTGGGMSGQAKISNIVIPPVTSVGVPFTLQMYFMNLTSQPMSFGGILNIQGLGLDMTSLPTILTQPGQAGSISQNLQIPVPPNGVLNAGQAYPGTVQLIHYNANGGQVVDDQQSFTIPAATSVAVGVMPTIVGTPSTVTPDTMMDAITGGLPTLPAVPGAGIVPMTMTTTTDPVTGMTMTVPTTATTPMWNPNDPMHMRGDECSNLPMMLPDLPPPNPMMPMTMMDQMVRQQHMKNQMAIKMRHDHCRKRKMGSMFQGGMLVDGKWVPNMPSMPGMPSMTSTTMTTDPDTGVVTSTMTSTMTGPSTVAMNPIVNNNMDLGMIRAQLNANPSQMGALPINSAANQVPGSWTPPGQMPPLPPGPAMLPVPQLQGAMNMPPWWNQQTMPQFNQQMWNQQGSQGWQNQQGQPWTQMQRTGSFQFMNWMNPNTGMPGTIAVPMMQMTPNTMVIPGAMLAEDLDTLPTIGEGEESTPFNDELDVMMLGRNRDRERGMEVPMPQIAGCIDVVPCGDNDEWATVRTEYEERTGTGLDVPAKIMGYNFCPNEMIQIKWHIVLWGGYGVEGQIFRGHDTAQADHSGRMMYHLRLPDLPDLVQGDGLVSCHGISSHKHANTTISVA